MEPRCAWYALQAEGCQEQRAVQFPTHGPRCRGDERGSLPPADLVARTSQSRCTSRTGQVDGVLMRWPDSAAIKDSQGLFMAVE
jgi:hypothetical protein